MKILNNLQYDENNSKQYDTDETLPNEKVDPDSIFQDAKREQEMKEKWEAGRRLQQYEIEWQEIQTKVQLVLEERFKPHVENQRDIEMLLRFHDQIIRK